MTEAGDNLDDDFLDGDLMPGDISFDDDADTPDIPDLDDDDDEESTDEAEEGAEGNDDGAADEDEKGATKDDGVSAEGDDNEWFLAAQLWQEKGLLSADVKLDPKMTHLDLEELRIQQVEADVVNRIQTKISDKLQAKGVNPAEIFNEQSQEEFFQEQYAGIAKLTYEGLLEKVEDVTKTITTIGTEYWIAKSNGTLEPDDVAPNVAKDLNSMTEEEALAKYQAFFSKEAQRLGTKIKADKDAAIKAENDKVRNEAIYIKEKLESGQIGGKKYTPEQIVKVITGMQKTDQIYDDGKGNRKPVTLFEKRRLEQSATVAKQLEYAVSLILGSEEPVEQKQKRDRVVAVNTLSKLAQATSGASKTNKKETTNKTGKYVDEDLFQD